MPDSPRFFLLLALLIAALNPDLAAAHKIHLFAAATGPVLNGYVYYPGGSRYSGAPLTIHGPERELLASLTADQQGEFTYEADCRGDHLLSVTTRDGHRATFLVPAAELPSTLPACPGSKPLPAVPAAAPSPINSPAADRARPPELTTIVEDAVGRQIRPLREQLARHEEAKRLQDVLGGIGYILGLTGLGLYWKSRRP